MPVNGAPLEESSCCIHSLEESSSFSIALRYQYFTQGQEKECDACRVDPHNKRAMKDLFEHYMYMHCGDVVHVHFYQAVWRAIMALCELTRRSLDAMPKRCPVVPPRTLKAANLDFVNKIEDLYQTLEHPPTKTAKSVSVMTKANLGSQPSADAAWRRFRIFSNVLHRLSRTSADKDKLGSSPSTDAVLEELKILDGVLRDLLMVSATKEEQVLSTIREFVELTRASKEDERFRLTCTSSGEVVYSHRPKISTITECMAGSAGTVGEASINGEFSTIRHGKVLYNTKLQPATLIALDLSLAGLQFSPVDHAVIEITYKDEPCGSQKELQASQIIEPHDLCGLRNGCLVTEGRVLAPEISADEQTHTKISSIEGDKVSTQDENVCWMVRGSTVQQARGGLTRTHRWVIDSGGDEGNPNLPDPVRLVVIVEHGLRPFDMEVEMKVRLRGLWRNSFRYLASLASSHAERFVIKRYEGDDMLTEGMAKDLIFEKYNPYVV